MCSSLRERACFHCIWKHNKTKTCPLRALETLKKKKKCCSYLRRQKDEKEKNDTPRNKQKVEVGGRWTQISCCFVLLPSLTDRIKNWRKGRTGTLQKQAKTGKTQSKTGKNQAKPGKKQAKPGKTRQMWFSGRIPVCRGSRFFLISLMLLFSEHNYSLSPSPTNIKSSRKPLMLFFLCFPSPSIFPPDICCGHRVCSPVTEQWACVMNCISLCVLFALPKEPALNGARSNKEPIKEIIYPFPRHIHESNLSSPSSTQSQDVALICL